ncbi:hypothetical protein HHI36_004865, partial [Cryptolaemus montrouzieri]
MFSKSHGLSDHYGQVLSFGVDSSGDKVRDKTIRKRTYTECEIAYFSTLLANESWEGIYSVSTLDEKFDNFFEVFTDLFERYFPFKAFHVNSEVRRIVWIARDIKEQGAELFYYLKKKHERDILSAKKHANDYFIQKSDNLSRASLHVINQNSKHMSGTRQPVSCLISESGDELCGSSRSAQNFCVPETFFSNRDSMFLEDIDFSK